ncbi:hypothetical protein AYI75_18005 [Shewanella algae]|nr:hypothetical protein AYI97_20715 [Shewanella algae]TWO82937.1 hypothetical protein AYI75_18005 [Shewanella algae]
MVEFPILMFLGFISVFLQYLIFLEVKKRNKSVLEQVFDGAFFKLKKGRLKRVIIFYYNPFSWGVDFDCYLKFLLSVNFIIATYFFSFILYAHF